MRRVFSAVLVGTAGLVLTACPSLDPETASQLASENVSTNLKGQSDALGFLADSGLVDRGLGGEMGCSPEVPPDQCESPDPFDMDQEIDELVSFLEQSVFVEANVESQGAGQVVYRLQPSVVCADLTAEQKTECESFFTDVPVRIVATSPAEGDLDLDILVGVDRVNPISLRIHHDELAAVVRLEATAEALQLVAAAVGEQLELPDVMTGEVEVSLRADAEQVFTFTGLVNRAVHIAEGDVDVQVAVASPAVSLTVDGATQQVTGAVSFGAIDLQLPASAFMGTAEVCEEDPTTGEFSCWTEEPPLSGLFAVHVAGLTGQSTFDGTADVLHLTGLGLGNGQATVTYDGQPFLAVDVNPDSGRTFDLTVTEATDGVDLAVSPELDLAVALDLGHAALEDPEIPAWAHDEDLFFLLQGTDGAAVRMLDQVGAVPVDPDGEPAPPPPTSSTALQVTAGTLTLDAGSLTAPVVVDAGMCLIEDLTVEGDVHPFSVISAGACGE